MVFVLHQLAVTAGQQVTGLTEQLQRLLFVDVAEHLPLRRRPVDLWEATGGSSFWVTCKLEKWQFNLAIFILLYTYIWMNNNVFLKSLVVVIYNKFCTKTKQRLTFAALMPPKLLPLSWKQHIISQTLVGIPCMISAFCLMVWSLVNLTLWWASTHVEHRYSTQSTQNPTASVLSSQVIQSYR